MTHIEDHKTMMEHYLNLFKFVGEAGDYFKQKLEKLTKFFEGVIIKNNFKNYIRN